MSLSRLALLVSIAAAAQATTINFTTNAASNSCFVSVYNDASSACQSTGASVTFSNVQQDSVTLAWSGVTNSVGFGSGPLQNVNYGSFTLVYSSFGGDQTPVTIPQLSFAMIVKEFAPSTIFFQPFLVNFTTSVEGDLQAAFSPSTVSNGTDTTFFGPATVRTIGFGQNNVGGQVQFSSTPEPSTWVLLGSTLVGIAIRKRSRK